MTWKDDGLNALDNASKAMDVGWSEQEKLNEEIAAQEAIIKDQQDSINTLQAEVARLNAIIEGDGENKLPVEGRIVPTFHCLGVYWNPPNLLPHHWQIPIRFAEVDGVWTRGFDLRYDERDLVEPASGQKLEHARGSIVNLKPGTHYLVQFGLYDKDTGDITWAAQQEAWTWAEEVKVASVRTLVSGQQTVTITQGGTADGYVLYDGGDSAVLDVKKQADYPIVVQASYVVIRRAQLRGGRIGCVLIDSGAHDVVIEKDDMSDWGSKEKSGALGAYGVNRQGAVTNFGQNTGPYIGRMKENKRIIVQRNKIHDPTYGSNDWSEGHPSGPHAVYLRDSGGNHVIRYNECYATEKDPRKANKYFNDCLGADDNAGPSPGFPGADSDIYQNDLSCAMDDMIEAEGMGCNVHIWGNRLDYGGASWIATNVVHEGPTYIWRNVTGKGRAEWVGPPDNVERTTFHKTGDRGGWGTGYRFVFHNTTFLVPSSESSVPMGIEKAATDVSDSIRSLYQRNNIWQMTRPQRSTYQISRGTEISVDYEMTNNANWGSITGNATGNNQPHGLLSKSPIFKPGHGYGSQGQYELADGSPGKNVGERIFNFNDIFGQTGPDFGAHEGGTDSMTFGVNAKT